jgi:hypothetical protein
MEILEVDGDYLKSDRALYAGLLGVALVTTVQILSVPQLGRALTFSIYAFAFAIPLLCFSLHAVMQEEQNLKTVEPTYVFFANLIGVVAASVGVAALFFHFSLATGICFLASALCSGMCRWRFDRALRIVNPSVEPS